MKTSTCTRAYRGPIWGIALLASLWGCAVDPEDDRIVNPTPDAPALVPALPAWIWVFDEEARSLRVFHSVDQREWAAFTADMEPAVRVGHGGLLSTNLNHTLWMARGDVAYAFTDGLLDHGDHGHIVLPRLHLQVQLGPGVSAAGLSASPDGGMVAVVDDQGLSVLLIDNAAGELTTVPCESARSSALLAGQCLVLADAEAARARLVALPGLDELASLAIGPDAGGLVYCADGDRAFIACADGIYVIAVADRQVVGVLPYDRGGGTASLYCAPGSALAVGLRPDGVGAGDRVLRLDMAGQVLDPIAVPGAALPASLHAGGLSLAGNGEVAVLADQQRPTLYHIHLPSGQVTSLSAPRPCCPVAASYDGSHVWVLDHGMVEHIHVPSDARQRFPVGAGADWIFVTSYKTGAALFDNEAHLF